MKILKTLLQQLPAQEVPVRDILVGVHWTAVCSRGCGLASSLRGDGPHSDDPVRDVGRLHQKSAQELAEWVFSENPLEAGIGMAALNSLLAVDDSRAVEINAADVLAREGQGKNIAIIGHFPFVERLRPHTRNLWVIEKRAIPGDLPEEAAAEYLPQADVVAITATTLLNQTFEQLIGLCAPDALVMMLGPTTPLSMVLFDAGINLISGARVVDEEAALRSIRQGAVFRQVQGVRLLTFSRPDGGVDGPVSQ